MSGGNPGGWASSKLFRMQHLKLWKQLDAAERRLRAQMEKTVKVYTPEEIAEYEKKLCKSSSTSTG